MVWALEGLRRLRKRGNFEIPKAIHESTREWMGSNDVPALFVEERCNRGENLKIKAQELYDAYSEWCEKTGHKGVKSLPSVAQDWKRLGFKKKTNTGNYWLGVDLKDHECWGGPAR